MRFVNAHTHLVLKRGKQVTRVRLIAFGTGAEKRAQSYAALVGGAVMPVEAIYSVMNPEMVEELGPGFIVVNRTPKYNLVVNSSFYYAEVK